MTCCPCVYAFLWVLFTWMIIWLHENVWNNKHLPWIPYKKFFHFSFHIVHVLPCFSPIVTRVCSIVRTLPLLHYSFMKTTSANLLVWTEKMFTYRGMNSSTLNDPFQPPQWRDCGLFDLICLICCHFIVCNFFYLAVCVLMFCPWSSGRCETSIKWRNKIHSLLLFLCVRAIHLCSFLQLFLYFTLCSVALQILIHYV